jgi:hypothetical protein
MLLRQAWKNVVHKAGADLVGCLPVIFGFMRHLRW